MRVFNEYEDGTKAYDVTCNCGKCDGSFIVMEEDLENFQCFKTVDFHNHKRKTLKKLKKLNKC